MLAKLVFNNVSIVKPHYFLGTESQRKFRGLPEVKDMLFDPETTLVVMVRDPLARFASAYLNKRFTLSCGNPQCNARRHFGIPSGTPISFRQTLDWFLSNHTNPASVNKHWRLQSEVDCGLKKMLPQYNVLGFMTKPTLSSDATGIMKMAGISDFNVRNGTAVEPFWTVRSEITRKYANKEEEEILKKLYTKEAALRRNIDRTSSSSVFQNPLGLKVPRGNGWIHLTAASASLADSYIS